MLPSLQHYRNLFSGLQNLPDSEKLAIVQHLAKTDLFFLLVFVLRRDDMMHPWLLERCREVQDAPDNHLDLWSREHYKSTIITFGYTILEILNNPELTFGIFSHTRPSAKGFLRQIKAEFERNELLKTLFPDVLYADPRGESPRWSEDAGLMVKRKKNPKESTIEAWGVVDGQPIGKHFDRLIYDDIVTVDSVTSPDMMQKTSDALSLSYALGAAGGVQRFIGTRYHQNDAYRTLLDRKTATPRIRLLTVDGTADGEPTLRTKEWVATKRRDMGPHLFSSQMLQNPSADETQGFQDKWLKYHDGVQRSGLNVYMLFDPAGSKNKRSDYTSGWVVGLAPDKNIYVLDMIRDRLNLTQRAALVMAWHRKYKPMRDTGVRYERYGLMADIEHIKVIQQQQNYRFDVTEVAGQLPKNDRIRRLIPLFEQGRVFLPRTHYVTDYEGRTVDLVQEFVEQEFKPFPVSIHDDMLDGLARLIEPDHPLIWPDLVEYDESIEPPVFEDS